MTPYLFSVIDSETSGFDYGFDEILTLYCIVTDGLNVLREKLFTFKPKRITNNYHKAFDIHGITIAQARKFNRKEDELNNLLEFLPDNGIMVCHSKKTNCYFDYGFLFMEFELYNDRINFYKKFKHCLSTHTLSKKFTKLKKRDLKSVSEYYQVELNNHHDAKSDTYACYEIFKKMYNENKEVINEIIESC